MKQIRLFITYLKKNTQTNEYYAGKASGDFSGNELKDALKIMKKRDSSHHKNKEGFELGEIDKTSINEDAIRGREQMLIEHLRDKNVCANQRNSISPRNKKRNKYLKAAVKLFGTLSIVFYILYICKII